MRKKITIIIEDEEDDTKIPSPPWKDGPPWSEDRICSTCGLRLSPVMGYVCPQKNCPSGLQIKTTFF